MAQESSTIEGMGFSAIVFAMAGFGIFILTDFWMYRMFRLHWIIALLLAFLVLAVYVILIYKLMSKKKK